MTTLLLESDVIERALYPCGSWRMMRMMMTLVMMDKWPQLSFSEGETVRAGRRPEGGP